MRELPFRDIESVGVFCNSRECRPAARQTGVMLGVGPLPGAGLAGFCPHVLITSLLEVFAVIHSMGWVPKSRPRSSASGPGGHPAPQEPDPGVQREHWAAGMFLEHLWFLRKLWSPKAGWWGVLFVSSFS